jgi:hypothetical protein
VSWLRLTEGFGTTVGFDHVTLHTIPEPQALALFALGLFGVAVTRVAKVFNERRQGR